MTYVVESAYKHQLIKSYKMRNLKCTDEHYM